MSTAVIDIQNVSKSFNTGILEVKVLKNISLKINKGMFSIIFGPSGCGKSTLLHIILGLEEPSQGNVLFLEKNMYVQTAEDDRSQFRKDNIGMVYQQANWIKSLSVVENVAFPLLLKGKGKFNSINRAKEVIEELGMTDWVDYIPTELSSGQQQRIALARALVTDPEVIIADEPTGNLDYDSGQKLMEIMTKLSKEGKTIIMVTHDLEYLTFANYAIEMLDGNVVEEYGQGDKKKLLARITSKRGHNIKGSEILENEK